MLQVLRNRTIQRRIFLFLAIAIIPSFVVVGVVTQEDKNSMAPLGTISGHKVSVKDYLDSYRAVQHQMQFMFGERWTEMRRYVNLKGEAWDRILLYQEAKRTGIRTSDQEVVAWISGQPAFQRQGKYYPELYRMAVREGLRMEPRDFEEQMRKTLTVQKYTDKILSAAKVDDAELKSLYLTERAIRDIEYIMLPIDISNPELTADDKEIENLYGMFKDRLTSPERVKLLYVSIPKAEAEAKKEILADNAATLETVAKNASLEIKSTGYFSRSQSVPDIGLSREILTAAFSLPVGGESGWIEHGEATFKIKIEDKVAERPLTLDEARDEIKKQVLGQKAIEVALKKMNDLKAVADKDGLEAAGKTLGLAVQKQDAFKPDSYVPGIGQGALISKQVSLMKEGEISAALAVTGGAALVRIKKDHAPDDAAFDKDKEEFRKEVSARKAQDAMRELLEKLRKDLSLNVERMKEIFPEDDPVS